MAGGAVFHHVFEALGYLAGLAVYAAQSRGRAAELTRMQVLAGAAVGAAIGSRVLFWLCDPLHNNPLAGKTIVGGLLGGLIGVEIAKKLAGVTRSTGDRFVLPLIAATCIGRLGCFLAGPADHTAGNPSNVPWAIAVGDGVPRHPVALYEIAFLIALIPLVRLRFTREGDSFRLFLASYLAFRFTIDFLKPDPHAIAAGLTSIQWACLMGIGYELYPARRRGITRSTAAGAADGLETAGVVADPASMRGID
jgi:phosphatidylglycerol:prolipoprotein diacylglycerol transferase